jgi:UDP-glucose:(heptosyl)LPS alpha-1,3-glucosyltransferase
MASILQEQNDMKLAFCLFNYFPYGGLQRDFLRIARLCRDKGHQVTVFTMRWEGPNEPGMQIHIIKANGWQNHARARSFVDQVKAILDSEKFDLVVGFNKMPYLDVYYAADVCYQSRVRQKHGAFYRLLPRYRLLKAYEEAVFGRGQKTQILLISPLQKKEFEACYQTEAERFYILPPGIAKTGWCLLMQQNCVN